MIYRADEIKFALQYLAVQKGRPHYELGIVKQVVNAFRDGMDHFLKSELLEILKVKFPGATYRTNEDMPNLLPQRNEKDASSRQFREFALVARSYRGAIKQLSGLSGISQSVISTMLSRGRVPLAKYKQLEPHFDAVFKASGV